MVNRRDRSALGGRGAGDGVAIAKHVGESGRGLDVVGSGRMGGALGLRAARGEPFGGGLSSAAREQPATVGVGLARTVGGVLWGPRGTRTANGRGVRPLGSGTRLKPSSADRAHLGWLYVVVAVWLPTPRREHSVGCGVENGTSRPTQPKHARLPTLTSWRSAATHRSGADTMRLRRSGGPRYRLGSGSTRRV